MWRQLTSSVPIKVNSEVTVRSAPMSRRSATLGQTTVGLKQSINLFDLKFLPPRLSGSCSYIVVEKEE